MNLHSPTSRPFVLGIGAGTILGLILVLLLMRWLGADPTPQLSFDDYLRALQRWDDEAPANYDVAIDVRGSQPASYFVQVRNGEARAAFRNGKYLPHLRSHSTWSIDGMFATLAEDVARLEEAQRQRQSMPFLLRVKFDSQYGFPAHYRRLEYTSPVQVEWDVQRFVPVTPGTPFSQDFQELPAVE